MTTPDVWLRGPIAEVPALLQPAAHALIQALEDVERVTAALTGDELWQRPGAAASAGFHLKHLAGATDRLMTYATGAPLSDQQRTWLALETRDGEPGDATVATLVGRFRGVVTAAIQQLAGTDPATLTAARSIGRAALPTTVGGCLFHAGEHASRHAGQLITTVRALR